MAGFLDGGITAGVTRFAEVARLYTDLGDLLRVVTPRSTRAHALLFAGRPAEGLPDSDAAVRLALDLGALEAEAYARWHRSELLTGCGRVEEALEDAARALAAAEQLAHRGWTATALRAQGLALRASGRTPAAESVFRRSLAAAAGLPLFTCWAHAQLALVLTDQGRLAEAADHVARALATGPPLGRYEARLAEVVLARARGDPDAGALAAGALRRARSGGHLMSARLLAAGEGQDRRP
ncbi:tetratricopeptide repeat protein [Geodermatophilus sp. SYSU D01176]